MLLKIENLSVAFSSLSLFKRKKFYALRDINLQLEEGKSLTLLGESGSGKTTLGRVIVKLLKPTEGKVIFRNRDIFSLGKEYTKEVSMVFQDPRGSLNPRYTVWEAVEEPLIVHKFSKDLREERVEKVLSSAGVERNLWFRKTAELSGGQRQRVAIARALVLDSSLIVADEPTSALDLSISYEILKLFEDLKREKSLIFITHDIRIGVRVGDKIALLLKGRLLEFSPTEAFVKKPLHPYGRYLFENLPLKSPFEREQNIPFTQKMEDSSNYEECPFISRCPHKEERCKKFPPPSKVGNSIIYCWLYID